MFVPKEKMVILFGASTELCALFVDFLHFKPQNLACAAFIYEYMRSEVSVHLSFKCFLSLNPQTVVTCSPQPPDICGTLDIGDLKLLSVHIFPLFLFPYSLFLYDFA